VYKLRTQPKVTALETKDEKPQAFKDHFSEIASGYAAHRPTYPAALVDFLADTAARHGLAWDCGCGTGQLSVLLAARFQRIVATDASREQIARAAAHPSVEYRCAPAQKSGLPDACVDLAVAAQAAHWFDLPAYYREVERVSRSGAVVALITYRNVQVDSEIDPLIGHFYRDVAGPHWPPERRLVEDGYRSIPFPFDPIDPPALEMTARWTLADLVGYVETWSALRGLEKASGRGPIEEFFRDLGAAWGPAAAARHVRWPLSLRVGRVR
jgi:SAM-dependent methyltransferase